MIQIGLCDDDLAILGQLRVLLDRYRVERNAEIASAAFKARWSCWQRSKRGCGSTSCCWT